MRVSAVAYNDIEQANTVQVSSPRINIFRLKNGLVNVVVQDRVWLVPDTYDAVNGAITAGVTLYRADMVRSNFSGDNRRSDA